MEIDPTFMCNLLFGFAMAGILVSLQNIRQALFTGICVAWLMLVFFFILSLSTIQSEDLISIMNTGIVFIPLIMVGYYLFFCVARNKYYIEENSMPDAWYLFSYFVVLFTGLNIGLIAWYLKSVFGNNERKGMYHSLAMLCTTFLFTFISIESIICTYFRTDGFTL